MIIYEYNVSNDNNNTALLTWRNVPNLHDLKIQEGGGRLLGFRKMSITLNWVESYLRKIWWADASRPCADDTWPKLETETLFCVTSLLWWIKMYILNECREHNRCADVKAYTRALNLQIFSLSLCRTHLFALLSMLLICHYHTPLTH